MGRASVVGDRCGFRICKLSTSCLLERAGDPASVLTPLDPVPLIWSSNYLWRKRLLS